MLVPVDDVAPEVLSFAAGGGLSLAGAARRSEAGAVVVADVVLGSRGFVDGRASLVVIEAGRFCLKGCWCFAHPCPALRFVGLRGVTDLQGRLRNLDGGEASDIARRLGGAWVY